MIQNDDCRQYILSKIKLTETDELLWAGRPASKSGLFSVKFVVAMLILVAWILMSVWMFYRKFVVEHYVIYDWIRFIIGFGGRTIAMGLAGLGLMVALINRQRHLNNLTYGFSKTKAFWVSSGFGAIVQEINFSKVVELPFFKYDDAKELQHLIQFKPADKRKAYRFNFERITDGEAVYVVLRDTVIAHNNPPAQPKITVRFRLPELPDGSETQDAQVIE